MRKHNETITHNHHTLKHIHVFMRMKRGFKNECNIEFIFRTICKRIKYIFVKLKNTKATKKTAKD